MSSPMFSIIVPIYNVIGYIEKTIESILVQKYIDFELILIDDGSTDGSGEFINSLSEIDARIRVFHQPNSGVSSARNLGIEKATGRWIIFVDGDDALKPNALQILVSCIESNPKVDLIGYGFESVSIIGDLQYDADIPEDEVIVDCSKTVAFKALDHYMVWSEAYQRNLIDNLKFEALKNGEDVLFCNTVACRAKCYMEINSKLYLYLQRGSSARANEWTDRRFEDYAQMHEHILANLQLCNKGIDPAWLKRWVGNLLLFIPQLSLQPKKNQKRYLRRHRLLLKKVKGIKSLSRLLKIWITVATLINSRTYYALTAICPMNLYSKIVNN